MAKAKHTTRGKRTKRQPGPRLEWLDPEDVASSKSLRSAEDAKDTSDLEASIRAHGLAMPPLVEKMGKKRKLLDGDRRVRALKQLGHPLIPVLTHPPFKSESERSALRLAANVVRRELGPEQRARYREMIDALRKDQGKTGPISHGEKKPLVEAIKAATGESTASAYRHVSEATQPKLVVVSSQEQREPEKAVRAHIEIERDEWTIPETLRAKVTRRARQKSLPVREYLRLGLIWLMGHDDEWVPHKRKAHEATAHPAHH